MELQVPLQGPSPIDRNIQKSPTLPWSAGARHLRCMGIIRAGLVLVILCCFAVWLFTKDGNNPVSEVALMEMLPHSAALSGPHERRFDEFFNNETRSEFAKHYVGECIRRQSQGNFNVFGAMLNGTEGDGFGSVISNAVNAYLLARRPEIDRTFKFFETPSKFVYLSPSYFFDDFAAESACPLYTNFDSLTEAEKNMNFFSVALDKVTQKFLFKGPDRAIMSYFGQGWGYVRKATDDLTRRKGTDAVFTDKAAFIRAMWNFKPVWRRLLKALWSKLVDRDGRYFAVHIRRGDKISTGEMADIPMHRYLAKLVELCRESNTSCPRIVFVMHDSPKAYKQFRALVGSQFTLLQLSDLLAGAEFDGIREHILNGERGGDQASWYRHTRELVFSLTLMAMADHVVCTFSSNLTRLVALINGNLTAFSSLDWDWHAL